MTGVLTTKQCAWCGHDIPRVAWRGPDPGDHVVILDGDTAIAFDGMEYDAATVRFTATQTVKLALCRNIIPEPCTGLGRMHKAVREARGEVAPDRPVTLCGELRPGDTYYVAGDPTGTPHIAGADLQAIRDLVWTAWARQIADEMHRLATTPLKRRHRIADALRRLAERLT